jgi:hypothetical protein
MWCVVPEIAKGCSDFKIKWFENRAEHVYRTVTLVASLTLWIQTLQASRTTGTTHPSRRHITEFLYLQQQHWQNLTSHLTVTDLTTLHYLYLCHIICRAIMQNLLHYKAPGQNESFQADMVLLKLDSLPA